MTIELKTHELKTLTKYFDAILSGEKTFEIRKNDRDFRVGDTLILHDWVVSREHGDYYSGGFVVAKVSYITDYMQQPDYVVMGINVERSQGGWMYRE